MQTKPDSLSEMRKSYEKATLSRSEAAKNPNDQFQIWLDQAVQAPEIYEANAMVVATASKEAIPSTRIVLLKAFDEVGFVFYTNYNSKKGHELIQNPKLALLFYWGALHRQIRIEGVCEKISPEQSTKYFHSRPKGSQIGALTSEQSKEIESRSILEDKKLELEQLYENVDKIPRPDHWGGFIVKPNYFEFWQGRSSRLHDRIIYKLNDGLDDQKWDIARLAP